MTWYPDSFHINTGAVASGLITDTYTDNGIRHTLQEVSGTPGFDYEYWYASIPGTVTHVRLYVNGYYDGNPAHIVDIQVWNFITSAWVDVDVMPDDSADRDYNSPDLEADEYISGGQLKVRFYHADPGVTSHRLYLDMVTLEDMSSFYSTAPPTTVVSTAVPTTTLTTPVPTTTLTTGPPTTAWGEDIYCDPIEITFGAPYAVLHYNPPAPYNEGLNTFWYLDPIEIVLSLTGENQYVGILLDPIIIGEVSLEGSLDIGQVIDASAVVNLDVTIAPAQFLVEYNRCNFIKWSKIGRLDFEIDESNQAGERPVDWKGCIWHIAKLHDKVVAYGANGVTIFKPSGVHFGMDTIYRLGLKNKGAFASSDSIHFFVDILGQLWRVDEKLTKLDYSEFISQMNTVILSLDIEKNILYICDGTYGFVYGVESGSFGEGPVNVTGIHPQSGNLYVVSYGEIVTPKFEICTDVYDLGVRRPKTIDYIEVGTDLTQYLYASIDYRTGYKDNFTQIGWFLVNPSGKAFPKCYGVEFRFRLMSTIYEYFELDYLKIRGHIHGYSYLDTVVS